MAASSRALDPVLMGNGPAECSSCRALSVLPDIIWDVNGYYRELGVNPRATRRDLRVAYQSRDGQSSPRLTFIMRQLLDPEIRFAYDCTPLGEVFVDDYVADMLNRKIKDEMSRRMADLAKAGVDLTGVDPDSMERDVAAEMGFDVVDEDDPDTPPEVIDDGPGSGQDDPDSPAKFEFSYYLWGTRFWGDRPLGRLAEWQRCLVDALAREGVSIRFAVGFHGMPHRWVEAQIGYRTAFLLNEGEVPTPELAADVAARWRRDRQAEQQQHHLALTER